MDRLQAMAVFSTVAELRGFAPAARRLRLSPPVVTRLVAGLEAHLGTRLLQRTTRTVALTDAGGRYLARVRRILADVGEAEASAQAERAAPAGRFVVAAPDGFGRRHVAPLLSAYLARFPAVTGELVLADRMASLVDEGIDAAVRIGHLRDAAVIARRVGATRRVAVASPRYLASARPLRRPEALADHRVIQFTGLGATPTWSFRRRGASVSIALAPAFATNSADVAIGHAERDGGVALALGYQVVDAVRAGRLRVVLASFEHPPLPIHVVYPSSRLLSAKVRAFVDLIAQRRGWEFVDL